MRSVRLRAACPPDHQTLVAPVDWQPDGRTSLQPDIGIVDPTGPAVEVFDLVAGEYRRVARAQAGRTLAVERPLAVTFDPAILVG